MSYELIDTLREDLDSDIWAMPPLYYRVWLYLRCLADHREMPVPMSDGISIILSPGQCITTIREIASASAWFERGILKVPNVRTIEDILCWMEGQGLIEREHGKYTRQFTKVTILHWNLTPQDSQVQAEENE